MFTNITPNLVNAPRLVKPQDPRGLRTGPPPCYPPAPMRENIRLVSSAGTGFTYYAKKNKRKHPSKLETKKYDPVTRQHVVFKEAKMPPHSK